MDSPQGLIETTNPEFERSRDACPACGAGWGALAPLPISVYGGVEVRRCIRCGSRRLVGGEAADSLDEGLPTLEGGASDPILAVASESEVRAALGSAKDFVSAPNCADYLDRIARSTARCIEGGPEDCRVLLFDEEAMSRLALPSGLVLVSLGALRGIEDEAELVFVLGHELSHVAAGDARRRLVSLGLAEVARSGRGSAEDGWLEAATDLMRLGHGAEREHQADLGGLRAVLAQGYDPESAIHYLERLGARVAASDPRVGELTLAHPLPVDRLRRLRKSWGAHVRDIGASRVNRDAFRRAMGNSVLTATLAPIRPFEAADLAVPRVGPLPWRDWRLIGTGLAILLLAAIFLLLGSLLAR